MHIKTAWYDHDVLSPNHSETNTLPSLTIPDQSMSISQILLQHSRGLSYDVGKVPVYEGENVEFNPIDVKKMDLSERHEILQQHNQKVADIEAKLAEAKTKKEREALKAELKAELELENQTKLDLKEPTDPPKTDA